MFVSQVCYEIVGSLALHDGVIIFKIVGDEKEIMIEGMSTLFGECRIIGAI